MIVQSKYTKMFHSDRLTRQKYDELRNFAVYLLNIRNQISQEINANILSYLEVNKFAFVTDMRKKFVGKLSSSFDKHQYFQMLDAYKKKFKAIQRKLDFETRSFKGFEYYKRDTKKAKKGDLKKVAFDKKKTALTTTLTYLARYGSEGTIDYICKQLKECSDDNKRTFYQGILDVCNKFGFERLYRLALSKRLRVINHHTKKPIEFRSLTFSGRSRKAKIIDYNKNFGSVINSFVSLSWNGRKSLDIPVTFSKDYHGKVKDYLDKWKCYEYTITFNDRTHQVTVHLYKDGDRYIPSPTGEVVGIDVNCKHNLFSLSDETTYDYDRKLVNDFCRLSLETDELKKNNDYVVGKRRQHKFDTLKMKMVKSEQQLISNMCKVLQSQGVGHVVMEDLDNSFGRSFAKDKDNEDINYNRKVKFLGLSSLKNEFEHIARKYDIAVSTVHASYTSKMCPVCGCIEDENRPDQETFDCIECGHKDNADFNAAKNIRNRVLVTVLRDKLLKQLDNGTFEPRKLKREKVKEVLLSYRTSLQTQVGSVT